MTTGEIVNELRDWADVEGPGTLSNVLDEAADRLEELDERVAIISEHMDAAEAEFDAHLKEIGVREE